MADKKPYHGESPKSNELRATTLYFCLVVSGGTWPEFSRVRKLGSVKKSRSFDVPAFLSCGFLSVSAGTGVPRTLGSVSFGFSVVCAGVLCACGFWSSGG